jgi:hypothetical protein
MNIKKLVYVLSAVFVLVGVSSYGFVSADNDKNNGNNGRGDEKKIEQRLEANNNGSTLEVHINDNGKVLVRGAKVTSVVGNTINAYTSWSSVNLNWAVNVPANSPIIRRFGGNGAISEVSVGDFISFQGNLVTTSASPIVVNATTVKDWSIQKNVTVRTTIEGQLKSIVGTVAPTSMVVTSGNTDYTVNIATDTSILNSLWAKTVLSSFKVGDKIRAYGGVTNFNMNATVVRNASLLQ